MSKDHVIAANGHQVGSGFDVEIKRLNNNTVLVCVTNVSDKREWLTSIDEPLETDLQALAVEIGNCPELGNDGWVPCYGSDEEWNDIATLWDGLVVAEAKK